ncbi:hypothetical protein [Streptomyces sp. NPDC005799]|uniref:hypothetical protein n=1 Tax=Streptomyces sp. NPDC005799 TaxID=3154678 RepID=UPI0033EF2CCE
MTIRPQDLPEIRADVLHWHLQHGPAFFDICIRAGKMDIRPAGPTHEAAAYLAKAEADRIMRADLYWIDAHMAELAMTAAESLPEFTLMPEDLPSPHGLMVFEKPVYTYIEDGRQTHLTAVAWGPFNYENFPYGGTWISWYSDRETNLEAEANVGSLGNTEKRIMRAALPALSYDQEEVYPFSPAPLPARTSRGQEAQPFSLDGRYRTSELLRVSWLLMQQPLADVSEVEPDRAARKRLRRAGREPAMVRIIGLRRPKSSTDHGNSDREYHHQWVVRGHWRQQWHPKREVHRPVWIAPHIKGPEGAPLIGGEKVYALKR